MLLEPKRTYIDFHHEQSKKQQPPGLELSMTRIDFFDSSATTTSNTEAKNTATYMPDFKALASIDSEATKEPITLSLP